MPTRGLTGDVPTSGGRYSYFLGWVCLLGCAYFCGDVCLLGDVPTSWGLPYTPAGQTMGPETSSVIHTLNRMTDACENITFPCGR